MNITVDIEVSKRGLPCLWECGGGFRNTGECQIVASADGRPKTAIYIRRSGMLANSEHALIPVQAGDIVVKTYQHRLDFTHRLYRIETVDVAKKEANLSLIATFSNGEWDDESLAQVFADAIAASEKKSTMYHCREAVYIKVKQTV